MLIDIALDAFGSDKAPEPEIRGAILACRSLPVRVHLVGPERSCAIQLDEHLENEDLPIVIHHASERIGMEEKAAHAVRSQEGQLDARRPQAGARGQGRRLCHRGQHRRGHGYSKNGSGRAARRRPPRPGHAHAQFHRQSLRAARCGRQRRLQAPQSGPVRRHGRDVRPHRAQNRRAARRPALHRRRRDQGQRPHPRGLSRCSKRCPSGSSATWKGATSSRAWPT